MKKERKIIEITTDELVKLLSTQERGTFFWMRYETRPKMRVTENPYTREDISVTKSGRMSTSRKVDIIKIAEGNYLMGNNYSDRVKVVNNLDEFEPQVCKVGNHISKCVLYNDNTKKYYLQYEVYKNDKLKIKYRHFGNVIEKKLLESYLIKSNPNPLKVIYPSIAIDNIKRIHFMGNQYIIKNSPVESSGGYGKCIKCLKMSKKGFKYEPLFL